MKKVYFLFLLCCVSFVALSQTTVTIYATGATGSFITGNSTAAARADGNIVTTAATRRGYAVFSLSTIPAGAIITSCTIGYNIAALAGGGGGATYETYGYAGNLSTVTTAAALFPDMIAGSPLTNVTYGAAVGNQTLASTAATTTFLQAQIGNTISICWTGGGGRTYTITGETGTAATTGAHAPYLSITYCAPPTAVTATAAPTSLCVGGTITLTGAATGATSYSWAGPGFTAATQNATLTATPGASGVYTLTAANLCGATTATATATTAAVTVNLAPAAIAGGPNVCTSQTTSLTDATTGGTWSSSTTSVATIGSSGTVSGVGTGATVITYSLGTGCLDTLTITDFSPPANITGGASVICVGSTLSLNDGTTGGVWSSSSTPVATVSATGLVTASSGGSATIFYTLPSGCFSSASLIVNPATVPDPITGLNSECVGSNTRLVDPSGGGNWSSSNSGTALVYPTGVVYGISAGTATITFTSASTDCFATYSMTVVATPAAIGGALSQCVGTTSTLTDATTGGAWSSSNTAVASIDPALGVVTGAALGTAIISYIVPPGCPVTAIVTINALPTAIVGSAVVCTGSTTLLTDATTGGGTWSTSTTTFATVGLTTGIVTGVAAGATEVTFTATTGCTAVAVMNDADPPAAITGGAVGICVGNTVTLVETSTGGTWSVSNTTIANVTAGGVVTGAAAGTDTVLYTLVSGCSAETPVSVNPLPAAIGGNASVCTGVTSTLTDATTGGTWSSSATGIATINSTTGAITGVLAGTATVTYTLGTGCIITLAVTDSDPPAAITGGAVAICAGLSVTLTETTTGGTWSTSNTSVSTVDGVGDVGGVAGGTDTVLYTLASGCFAGTPISVNALPAAIAGGTNVCTGSSLNLTDASTGGTWSSSTTTVATVGSASGTVFGVLAGTTTITYTLGTGCVITSVITDSDPPGALSSISSVVCQGANTTLTEGTTGGAWSSSNTGVATVDVNGIVYGVGGGVATISYVMPTGCFVTLPITVNPAPAAISGAVSVCTGTTTILTDGTTGGTWSSLDNTIASIDPASGIVTGEGAGTTTISYILTATGCSSTTTMTDNDPPVAIGGLTVVCVGSTITLTETTTGGAWSSSNNSLATVDGLGNVTGVTAGDPTISYIMPTGCYNTLPIVVNPLPFAIVGATSICTGSTTVLTDGSGALGTWSSTSNAIASIDATSGTVTGEGVGTATISYVLIATGCFVTSSMTDTDPPVAIFGPTVVCQLAIINLSDGTGGGTWVSANAGIATVDGSGDVTGVNFGATTISYILTATGCFVTSPVTVNPIPDAISGSSAVCTAGTTALTDGTTAGTWSTSAAGIASVDAVTGTVYGMASGTATISFTITATGCFVTASMIDNDPPTPIVGTTPLCVGATVTFTDAVAEGGIWSSEFPLIATANALTGDIFGSEPGVDSIFYTVQACPAASFAITVNPTPTPITGPTSVCVGDSILLTDATPGGFWGSGFPGVALVDSAGEVTGQDAGVVTINYTIGGCTPASYTITVNPMPTSIGGLTQVCATLSTLLTDGVSGGIWTSSLTSVATVSATLGNVSGVAAGTTTISYTLPAGCYQTLLFTVNPLPDPITFPVAVVCQGSVITFSELTTGGVWSSSTTTVATVGTGAGLISGVAAGTSSIIYTLPTGCLWQAPVTVNPLPLASTGPTMVCVDATITLVNTSPGGPGSWSSSNTSVATAGLGTGVISGVSVGTTSIVFSLPTGCNTSTTVYVNPLPAVIFGLSSVCAGSAITLTDITPGGTWSSSSTAASVVPSLGVVNGMSAGVSNISYILTATGCSATTPVTVNPLPAAISGPVTVCSGTTITLTEGDTGGEWSTSDVTIATVGSATGVVTGVAAGAANILYTFPSGCSTGFAITTQPTPVITITAGGPLAFCTGGSVTLNATPATAGVYVYQWYDNGTAIPTAIGSSYTAVTSGLYTVVVSNSFSCADSTSIADTVSNGIFPLLNDTGAISICAGNNLAITATNGGAVGALTYIWEQNGTAIPGASTNIFDITAPGVYNVQLTVTGLSGFCSVFSNSVTITVNPLPTPTISYDGSSLSTTPIFTSYEWFLNTVGIPGATSSSYMPTTDGSYRVLVVDANGCDGYSPAFNIGNVGVKQVTAADIKIYPNPATSIVHIVSPVSVRAVITSVEGKVLLDQDNAKELNINSLADGLYLIVIYGENGNQLMLEKLIKE